jgi:23S rRNA (uracil1939-C5)-methyltransferase
LQSWNARSRPPHLVDGGYRIARVTPVDQFLFSPHIEVVAQLER